MKKIYPLENSVKSYDWGDPDALPEFVGYTNKTGEPQAELWMGVHPRGESIAVDGKTRTPLSKLTGADREGMLGKKLSDKFGSIPFLFKVLTVGKSLSLQVHPDKKQAETGFKRENLAGVAIDAINRNYRDGNHKPEIIAALSNRFEALCGFRPVSDILDDFNAANFSLLKKQLEAFRAKPDEAGWRIFFTALLDMDKGRAATLAKEAAEYAETQPEPRFAALKRLHEDYPDDLGALAPLYLNLIELKEGEALYLPAGILHNYLSGFGVELMANSDNTLRGGLTSKHIDKRELLDTLIFAPYLPEILNPEGADAAYPTPAEEFVLEHVILDDTRLVPAKNRAQILLCVRGKARLETTQANISAGGKRFSVMISRGKSVFLPYGAGGYELSGKGEFYIAKAPF